MREPKMGGASSIRVFVKANEDVAAALIDASARGEAQSNVADLVRMRAGSHVDVVLEHESSDGVTALVRELEAGSSTLVEHEPDIVILSVSADLHTPADEFRDQLV